MDVAPASATPSQEVALRFPADSQRGIAFSLSRWSPGEWHQNYYLTSDWGMSGNYAPSWWTVEDSADRGSQQVVVSSSGPDRGLVPDTAPPGDHLLMTANPPDEACALSATPRIDLTLVSTTAAPARSCAWCRRAWASRNRERGSILGE